MVIPTGRLPDIEPAELLKEQLYLEASALEDWYVTDFWEGYADPDEEALVEELLEEELDWAA